jgi:hypothetical protein
MNCKKCGTDLSGYPVKEGISKARQKDDGTWTQGGKPYKMVKCNCGNAEFLPFGKYEPKPKAQYVNPAAEKAAADFNCAEHSPAKPIQPISTSDSKQLLEILVMLKKMDAKLDAMSKKVEDTIPPTPEELVWNE